MWRVWEWEGVERGGCEEGKIYEEGRMEERKGKGGKGEKGERKVRERGEKGRKKEG